MAKGATCVPNPSGKRQKTRKSTGRIDQQGQSQTHPTKQHPFGCLLDAERDCNDKFACYNCLTLKHQFEFEDGQAIMVRRMDLPEYPVELLRRVCIDCGIEIGLYRSGHVLKRGVGPDCWICDCPRAHKKDDELAGIRCDDCGMTMCFSTPAATSQYRQENRQNDIVPIYPPPPRQRQRQRQRGGNNRFTTVPDLDLPPPAQQVRKTSIPYLLCPTSTPVLLSPPYQHAELAGSPESEEADEGAWSPML